MVADIGANTTSAIVICAALLAWASTYWRKGHR